MIFQSTFCHNHIVSSALILLAFLATAQMGFAQQNSEDSFAFKGDFTSSGGRTVELLNDIRFTITRDISLPEGQGAVFVVMDEIFSSDGNQNRLDFTDFQQIHFSIERMGSATVTGTLAPSAIRDNFAAQPSNSGISENDGVFFASGNSDMDLRVGDVLTIHAGGPWTIDPVSREPDFNSNYNDVTFSGSLFLLNANLERASENGVVVISGISDPVINRLGFNASGGFEIEARGLQTGNVYILQRVANLSPNPTFDHEADRHTATTDNYTFTDDNPLSGKAFYRVSSEN